MRVCKSVTILGVHIGVYQPCPDLKRNLDPKRLVDHIGAYQA